MKLLLTLTMLLSFTFCFGQKNYSYLDSLHYKVWWTDFNGKKKTIKDSVIITNDGNKFLYKTGIQVGFVQHKKDTTSIGIITAPIPTSIWYSKTNSDFNIEPVWFEDETFFSLTKNKDTITIISPKIRFIKLPDGKVYEIVRSTELKLVEPKENGNKYFIQPSDKYWHDLDSVFNKQLLLSPKAKTGL